MESDQKKNHAIWAIVPAAGIGKRMQSDIPKQYMSLNGRPVIEHTINALLRNDNISGLAIALQADDNYWPEVQIASNKPVLQTAGGKERSDSVLNAIRKLFQYQGFNRDTDWVMVHDAVRPCLRQQDIDKLAAEVTDASGGLLAFQPPDCTHWKLIQSDHPTASLQWPTTSQLSGAYGRVCGAGSSR